MSESKLQAKILQWLKSNGFYVFKTVVCNRNGIPDIIGCTPTGQFFAIEVKVGKNKASKLQEWNIQEIKKRGGLATVAYSLEEVKLVLAD
jgi:Holliday junction resolvase